jgi:alpha-tubulin suppressor-like RCC1 family protein
MSGFSSAITGEFDRYFMTTTELIDQYTTGGLWTWGLNNHGQLGNSTSGTGTDMSFPSQTIAGGINWRQVSCGGSYTAAIKTDGTLWTCGYNMFGQIGDSTLIDKSSPVYITGGVTSWKQVACGNVHTAAIKTDGTLWTFGLNNHGQIGDGTLIDKSSPVYITGGITSWKQVACGSYTTAAIKTDGTLWTFGLNNHGQIGDGTSISTTVFKSTPVQVGSLTTWKQVSCGEVHTAAIKTAGTLWTWGYNFYGELGDGTLVDKSSPVQVGLLTNWKQVACGYFYTAAIKTDGTLWTFGLNNHGQIGDGTSISTAVFKSTPVQVGLLTNWKQVACGYSHTAAIKTDGTLWSWGFNDTGQLGDGTSISTTVFKSTPVQVGLLTNWKQVACGSSHTAAVQYSDFSPITITAIYTVVGGGGGGSSNFDYYATTGGGGYGGGGGEVLQSTIFLVAGATNTISIGAGGTGGPSALYNSGNAGSASSFASISARGGLPGIYSGGGDSGNGNRGTGSVSTNTNPYGFLTIRRGNGGGAGSSATQFTSNGSYFSGTETAGSGIVSIVNGIAYGGGGGGTWVSSPWSGSTGLYGLAGADGGADGGVGTGGVVPSAVPNRGGGGGGVIYNNAGTGGSGVVLIKIPSPFSVISSTATYTQDATTSPGNVIYTFTSSGTATFGKL